MSEQNVSLPVSFRLKTGRFSNTLVHQWLWSVKRNKWVTANCHGGVEWGCDYLVYPGPYIIFSLEGFQDGRGLTIQVMRDTVMSDGRGGGYLKGGIYLKDRNVLAEVTIPYRQFVQMFPPFHCPSDVPEALRDFLDGRPRHYHSVSASPPADKQYQEGEIERVVSFLSALRQQFAES